VYSSRKQPLHSCIPLFPGGKVVVGATTGGLVRFTNYEVLKGALRKGTMEKATEQYTRVSYLFCLLSTSRLKVYASKLPTTSCAFFKCVPTINPGPIELRAQGSLQVNTQRCA